MGSEKHSYIITFNKLSKHPKTYTYNYSNTKNIKIKISSNAISININMGVLYTKEEMFSYKNHTFSDAIRKAMLLHIIIYSRNINVKMITIQTDDKIETEEFNNENMFPVHSLINYKLKRKLPKEIKKSSIINNILTKTKSDYDSRMSSLFALIYSKSKTYEVERFIYLWMAFNGMYGFFAQMVPKPTRQKKLQEWQQILALLKTINSQYNTIRNKKVKTRIADKVKSIIKRYENRTINRKVLENNNPNGLRSQIESILKQENEEEINISAYGYILTQFSYHFRCKIIHAERTIPLFSYSNDSDIISLKVINNVLEEYIDENLPKWLNEKYVKDTLNPLAREIRLNN